MAIISVLPLAVQGCHALLHPVDGQIMATLHTSPYALAAMAAIRSNRIVGGRWPVQSISAVVPEPQMPCVLSGSSDMLILLIPCRLRCRLAQSTASSPHDTQWIDLVILPLLVDGSGAADDPYSIKNSLYSAYLDRAFRTRRGSTTLTILWPYFYVITLPIYASEKRI
jgi:hypothetical protein